MSNPERYAVFGDPVKHSKSPRIHTLFAEQTGQTLQYHAQHVLAGDFQTAVAVFFAEGGKGINCTLPLKELAWAYATTKTERAQCAKAVNTLSLQTDGSLLGDNTDGCGLIRDLTCNLGLQLAATKILILGAGGAARGIIAPLLAEQAECVVVANRTPEKATTLAEDFRVFGAINGCGFAELQAQQFDLIINATSASLTGQLPPLPADILTKQGYCYDLAYADSPTAFVRWGLENNASKSVDGLGMLIEQAAEAFYIWRGVRPLTQPVIDLFASERKWIIE